MIGKTLAHYEIQSLLGKGGMGEVYRARDTKLGRDVAIKVLPREMSGDPERIARFQREARNLASLQHPNVASVYGFEELPEARFLVMELVEGEDLAERLQRGPLSIAETERLARQIAAGLAAAHDQGLVHRDLKPANIKISADGEAKILDFGLARAYLGEELEEGDPANSPTITAAMTQAGTILGTAAYMSPEQARGHSIDKRTDIWAFGCVLFECMVGERVYSGDTVTDVIASIIHRDPDWDALPRSTPPALRKILELCLQKSRNDRLRDMGDVILFLDQFELEAKSVDRPAAPRRWFIWVALAALLGVAAGSIFLGSGAEKPGVQVEAMSRITDLPGMQWAHALSPDGSQIAYTSEGPEGLDIFVQRVSGMNPRNLTADNPGFDMQPAFSPDGQSIAFASDRGDGGIFVMGATGETPLRLTDSGFNPEWSHDGKQIAYVSARVTQPLSRSGYSQLRVVDVASRQVRDVGNVDAMYPSWSPSGKRIVFATYLGSLQGQRDLWTVDVPSGVCTPLLEGPAAEWSPVWSPDGRWIYYVSDQGGIPNIWRIEVDETSGEAQRNPQRVTAGTADIYEISLARNGAIAASATKAQSTIWTADLDLQNATLRSEPKVVRESSQEIAQLATSSDGTMVTFFVRTKPEFVAALSLADGSIRHFFGDGFRNRGPRISEDGRWLVYYSNRSGSYDIWAIRMDGTGARPLTHTPDRDVNGGFLTRTGTLYFATSDSVDGIGYARLPEGGLEAVTSPLEVHVLEESAGLSLISPSPDGSWLAARRPSYNNTGFGIWSLLDEGTRIGAEPDHLISSSNTMSWLDDNRLVRWDRASSSCTLQDLRTGESMTIVDVPDAGRGIEILRDESQIVGASSKRSTDLWLIELREP